MDPEAFQIGNTASPKDRVPDSLQHKTGPKSDTKIVNFQQYLQGVLAFGAQHFFSFFFGAGLRTGAQSL